MTGNKTISCRPLRIPYLLAGLAFLAIGLGGCELLPATSETPSPTVEVVATATPEPTSDVPPGVTQLVFWEPFPLDRPQGLLLGEMIRDFEAETPDILIDIVPKSGYVGIHGAMLAALEANESGELPDLAVAFPSMIAEYAAAGIVAPLDPYLYDPELGLTSEALADVPRGFLNTGRFPGFGQQILAFPFVQNAIGMWVNETLLTQAGWDRTPATWNEFEQACYDVITITGVRCYPFIESVSTFNAWLYSRGGRQLDESGRRAMFNGPEGVESMALLRRLMEMGLAWRPQDQYGDYTAFANGQAAFTFASTGNSQLYADAYEAAVRGETPAFQWRQTMIPQADPANPATALYGTDFFVVRSEPGRERAAWRFIRWFTDQTQTARWSAELQAMPVRVSALEIMTDTLETYPFFREQVEGILPFARPEPAVAGGLEVREILYTAILSVTQSYGDPQAVLDQAAAEANAALSRQP